MFCDRKYRFGFCKIDNPPTTHKIKLPGACFKDPVLRVFLVSLLVFPKQHILVSGKFVEKLNASSNVLHLFNVWIA